MVELELDAVEMDRVSSQEPCAHRMPELRAAEGLDSADNHGYHSQMLLAILDTIKLIHYERGQSVASSNEVTPSRWVNCM